MYLCEDRRRKEGGGREGGGKEGVREGERREWKEVEKEGEGRREGGVSTAVVQYIVHVYMIVDIAR